MVFIFLLLIVLFFISLVESTKISLEEEIELFKGYLFIMILPVLMIPFILMLFRSQHPNLGYFLFLVSLFLGGYLYFKINWK